MRIVRPPPFKGTLKRKWVNEEKFYDNIQIGKLIPEVRATGYPLRIATLGLMMHMAPRILRGYGHHVLCAALPDNSIIAGCTQSTYLTKVMLLRIALKRKTNSEEDQEQTEEQSEELLGKESPLKKITL